MDIFKYLLQHKLALLLVIVLLFGVAACNLALPAFTSQIVDVGIQQSGVEHAACEVMTESTHEKIAVTLDSKELTLFENSYDQDEELYKLNEFGSDNIDELDAIISAPLIAIHEGSTEGEATSSDTASSTTSGASVAATASNDTTAPSDTASSSEDSLLDQRAISAAISEYEAAGYDLSALRISYLIRVGLAMMGLSLLSMLLDILIAFIASRTGSSISKDLRSKLFSRVVSFSEQDIEKFSAASLITRGTNDIQLIQNVSIMLLRMVLYAPILALGGIIMVLITSPQLGWIVIVAVLLVFIIAGTLFRITIPKFTIMQKLIDRVNLVSREILTGIPVIRAFNRQKFESDRFDVASKNLMSTQLFTNRAMSFMMPTMTLVMNLTSVAIVWFGGFGVADGSLQTGDLIAFITYSMLIIMGFLMLAMMAIMLPRANVAAIRVNEVLSTDPSIQDAPGAYDLKQASEDTSQVMGASVEFENVSFSYDKDACTQDVLKDITFKIDPGQTVAIVGPTGSGKTTILKLIERFLEPTSGCIKIDGIDVLNIRQESLRQMIGYAPQDSYLFSGTIATNVAYCDEEMDDERIGNAIAIAQAKDFIESTPEGLDSPVAQGGYNLSGGQRQRVSIARAIASRSRLLLFDDSFSALDYKTDSKLRSELKKVLGSTTCIIVAQRISTVMDADSIIVLEDGRLVGLGTHEHLLQTCEHYKQIALSQLSEEELYKQVGDLA